MGEPTAAAVVREVREETGQEVSIERLVWVAARFFARDGVVHHELGFYYLVRFVLDSPWLELGTEFHGEEEGRELIFRRVRLRDASALGLYPIFLRSALHLIPGNTTYILFDDRSATEGATGEYRPVA